MTAWHALRVARDIPGLPDLAPGDVSRRARVVVLGSDHAALELLEHQTALPGSRIAVTRQWLAESLPLTVGCRRVLGRNRTGQRHFDVSLPGELHFGGWGLRLGGDDQARPSGADASTLVATAAARGDQCDDGQADDCRVTESIVLMDPLSRLSVVWVKFGGTARPARDRA